MKKHFLLMICVFVSIKAMDVDEKFKNLSEPVKEVIGHYLHNIEKLEKEALKARAKGIGLRLQNLVSLEQALKDTIALGDFIDGKLRFRLVEFFIKSEQSRLSPLSKLMLMHEFVKSEQKEDRRKYVLEQMYELVTKDVFKFESHHQIVQALKDMDIQTQEAVCKKFYRIPEFKRLHEAYKKNITTWSLEKFLYFWEFLEVVKRDAVNTRLMNEKEELKVAIAYGGKIIANQKEKDSVRKLAENIEIYRERLKKLGFPYHIDSEKFETILLILGTVAQEQLPEEKRNFEIAHVKEKGEKALRRYLKSCGVELEDPTAFILNKYMTLSEWKNVGKTNEN